MSDFDPLIPSFAPVPVRRRRDGWTVERQRGFIRALSETGCVLTACREVGMQPRSAYRLAARPDGAAFAAAWDQALVLASRRLSAFAFEYATQGMIETVTNKDGEVIAERRRPSERLLIYLLTHLDSNRFGPPSRLHPSYRYGPSPDEACDALAPLLDALEDVADEEVAALPPPADDDSVA